MVPALSSTPGYSVTMCMKYPPAHTHLELYTVTISKTNTTELLVLLSKQSCDRVEELDDL